MDPRRQRRETAAPNRGRIGKAFTLIEMLTTVLVLIIVLGLMVSLARYVRKQAAIELTRDLLRRLDTVMVQYAGRNGGKPPVAWKPFPTSPVPGGGSVAGACVAPAVVPGPASLPGVWAARVGSTGRWARLTLSLPDEAALQAVALENNREFVKLLRQEGFFGEPAGSQSAFGGLPVYLYDEVTLRDAWGDPIVFLPSHHDAIGTAPQDRFFFFSAGPDRRYLSQDDNLYSYEER